MDFEEEPATLLPDFLRDPLGIPRRRWPWMMLGLMAGLMATAAATYMVIPKFGATATILLTSQYIPEDFVRTTVRGDSFSQLNAHIGEVLSRTNLVELIERFDLYPQQRERTPLAEIVNRMRSDIDISPVQQLQGRYLNRNVEASRVYGITYENPHPTVSAHVANSLASLFLEAGIKNRMERALGITEFLRKELARSERELEEQNGLIADFKEEHRGELPDELGGNLGRLERLQSQRDIASRQLAEAESRMALLSASDADPNSPGSRLAALQARLDQELAVNTPEHPNVASLERQIVAVRKEMEAGEADDRLGNTSRDAMLAAAQHSISSLHEDILRFETEAADLDISVRNTSLRQDELSALERKATVLRENYLSFLRKVEEAELAQTLESNQYGAQISLMDAAQPPSKPKQGRLQVLLTGIAASVVLSLLLGVLMEFLNPLIIDSAQVEAITGLPVLGSIPKIA